MLTWPSGGLPRATGGDDRGGCYARTVLLRRERLATERLLCAHGRPPELRDLPPGFSDCFRLKHRHIAGLRAEFHCD